MVTALRTNTAIATVKQHRIERAPLDERGRYTLVRTIATGGMAEVVGARDTLLGRDVAIKLATLDVIGPDRTTVIERLWREAQVLAAVKSRHIVAIHDVFFRHDVPCIVLELVRGRTLSEELARFGPMEVRRAARLAINLLDGLTTLHGMGFVHRDIKASNVIVDPTDTAVLIDFGIAIRERGPRLTPPGLLYGTPETMAPEVRGGAVDMRADLFQVALLLARLIGGVELDPKQVHSTTSLLRYMPAPFAEVVARGLADVSERFTSATRMRVELEIALTM